MAIFYVVGSIIIISTFFAVVNYKFIRMPTEIGQTFISMLFGLTIIVLGKLGETKILEFSCAYVNGIDLNKALMIWMLGPILFSGSMNVNINELIEKKWEVGVFSTFGVIISTIIFSFSIHYVFNYLGLFVSMPYCFAMGALISPTDPIAALGVLRKVNTPKSIETKMVGEALFNDGVGIVLFLLAVTGITTGQSHFSFGHAALFFFEETFGGALLGMGMGYGTFRLLRIIDEHVIEIMLTISLVLGIYIVSDRMYTWFGLHLSAPIAVVVAGLFIGNHGRRFAMSKKTKESLDTFWKIIDHVLNMILFGIIGLEVLTITFHVSYIKAGIAGIAIILSARYISVLIPVLLLKKFKRNFTNGVTALMTWGGMRGPISIALAISLPKGETRGIILAVTSIIVFFSILVQGLTIKSLAERFRRMGWFA